MESSKSDTGTNKSREFIENTETFLQDLSIAETGIQYTGQVCATSLLNSTKWKLHLRRQAGVTQLVRSAGRNHSSLQTIIQNALNAPQKCAALHNLSGARANSALHPTTATEGSNAAIKLNVKETRNKHAVFRKH